MPTPGYLTIIGAKQGLITEGNFTKESVGNIYQEGHEHQILVQSFEHRIMIPRDPQSGQPTGQRVHEPFKITKVIDKSSPLLFRALSSGELLTTVEFKLYRASEQGMMEQHYYTITLTDAVIVDITAYMPNYQDPQNQHLTHMEDVFFTYREITKTHEIAGTSGTDDWRRRA